MQWESGDRSNIEDMRGRSGGRMVPIAFNEIREPGTGRTRVRMVNTDSEGYRVAREYMIRLEPEDFKDPYWVRYSYQRGCDQRQ